MHCSAVQCSAVQCMWVGRMENFKGPSCQVRASWTVDYMGLHLSLVPNAQHLDKGWVGKGNVRIISLIRVSFDILIKYGEVNMKKLLNN